MEGSKNDPPLYMEKGSSGRVVDLVLGFLIDWAKRNGEGSTDIVLDGDYADTGVVWMKKYQGWARIDADGGCGPQTRAAMKQDGFDFVNRANSFDRYTTAFVQPDGSVLYWTPGMEPTTNEREVDAYLSSKRIGN